jgi:hypothetical protein
MSDIAIQFTWLDLVLVAGLIGWPGLLLGAAIGATAWRRHRIYGAGLGALLGLALCVGAQFAWG